jgi:hypothetical protein
VNWRALIVVVVLGVVIALAIRAIQGWPEDEFTVEEKAMMEALAPVLYTLVVQEEDLSSLSEGWEACLGERHAVNLQLRGEGSSPELEGVEAVEPRERPRGESSFCNSGSGGYVSSVLVLPLDNPELVRRRISGPPEGGPEMLVEAFAGDLGWSEAVVDYGWLNAPGLGDSRFALARSVLDTETNERFEFYDFSFMRGVVLASLTVNIPSSPAAEDEARALAQTLDGRIAAKLESLAAEVQVP